MQIKVIHIFNTEDDLSENINFKEINYSESLLDSLLNCRVIKDREASIIKFKIKPKLPDGESTFGHIWFAYREHIEDRRGDTYKVEIDDITDLYLEIIEKEIKDKIKNFDNNFGSKKKGAIPSKYYKWSRK